MNNDKRLKVVFDGGPLQSTFEGQLRDVPAVSHVSLVLAIYQEDSSLPARWFVADTRDTALKMVHAGDKFADGVMHYYRVASAHDGGVLELVCTYGGTEQPTCQNGE